MSPTTRKDFLLRPTFSTRNLIKKPALKRGRISDGGPLSGVGVGDGEGEVLGEEKFEQYLGELAFERFLGRDLRDLGASFFFPTPAGPLAESVSSFPLSSPWLSPLPSPAARVNEPPPHPDLLPSHSHWPHPRCQWHDIAHWTWGAAGILDECWKDVLCPGKENNAA